MGELVYTMHFRGQLSRSLENDSILKLASSGTSCCMDTVVGPTGPHTTLRPAEGDLAFIDSEVRLTGGDTFEGSGVLTFGDDGEHAVHFSSIQSGHLRPGIAPGVMAGAVSWRVEGGSGRFKSASGFITSTFTLKDSGELSDYHCGLIFFPE